MRRSATRAKPASIRGAAPVLARPRLLVWLLALLLVLVTIALYWPAMQCGFVNYDDDAYVTSNVQVQNGLTWEGIKWACVNPVCWNWHPVTVWSHMLVCQLVGLNPWGHHLTNVLLHALNAGLLFALLQLMTGATWRSLLVAALFAFHPLRVESVAWVSERKDELSGFFGLLALIAYARYAQRLVISNQWSVISQRLDRLRPTEHRLPITDHRLLFYYLSLFLLALGLMSKPMLVTWPFVMLLLDYWPLGRMQNAECRMQNAAADDRQHATRNTPHVSRFTFHVPRPALLPLLFEKIPFFVLVALASVVTIVVQQREGALTANESLPLGARVANALISYGRYLGKSFWPADLAVYYPHPEQWPLGKVLMAGGLLLGISVVVWAHRRRHPYSLVGWLCFVGMLVPVIGLVQAGGQSIADRYTYLPSLGVLVLAVWGAYELTRGWRYHALVLWSAGVATIILCLVLTTQQLGHWKDGESLFRHALRVTEDNHIAHNNLGVALGMKGQIDEAISQLQEAVRAKPDYADAHSNLGNALLIKGQVDEAIPQLQEAIRLKPDHAAAHYNLGIAFGMKGQLDEAISQYQETLRLNAAYADAKVNLAKALELKSKSKDRASDPGKP